MRQPSLEALVSLIRLYEATQTQFNTVLLPQGARRISSLRAFRRARGGEAKGRVDWKRIRWPDAKFEGTGAQCPPRSCDVWVLASGDDSGGEREKRENSRPQDVKAQPR